MTEENTLEADVTPVNPEQPVASLTLQDLTLTANIIDLATQRGAFKAAEATTVGNAFQKLVSVIQAVQPPKPEGEDADAENAEAPTVAPTAAPDAVASDSDIAQNLINQAKTYEEEATNLREQAYEMDPSLKPRRGRPAKAKV